MLSAKRPVVLKAGLPGLAKPVARGVAVKADKRDQSPLVSAELAIFTTLAAVSAQPAYADVDTAVGATVESVKAAGDVVKSGLSVAEGAAGYLNELYQKVSPKVNELLGRATPYVKSTYDEVSRVAVPAVKDATSKAVPIVTEGTRNLLRQSGVDVDTVSKSVGEVTSKASQAVDKAAPALTQATDFLSNASPETLAKVLAGTVAAYYLTPLAIKAGIASFRGYAGEISPARAVDVVASDNNVCLIDIRSLKEKSATGVPDIPSSARGRFVELEVAEIDRRLRGQLKNVDSVEAQVTALEVQALKRVNKRTQLLLLDRNGSGVSKNVAKELSRLGFRSVFVVAGGFSGWTASKLQTKAPVPGAKTQGALPNILGTISMPRRPEARKTK